MSALATFFLKEGKNVSGYDRTPSGITRRLEQMGASIHYEMDAAHLKGQELVIYTPAIASATEEFRAAVEHGIPMMKRAQALGEIGLEDHFAIHTMAHPQTIMHRIDMNIAGSVIHRVGNKMIDNLDHMVR